MKLYTVQQGDTMWKIAKRYGIPTQALISANPHIYDSNVLHIGDQLYLPIDHIEMPPIASGFDGFNLPTPTWPYVVKKADTLWKISHQVGVPLEFIVMANPQISDPNQIVPGQVVQIPSQPQGGMGYGQQGSSSMPPVPTQPPVGTPPAPTLQQQVSSQTPQPSPMKPVPPSNQGGTPPAGYGFNASFDAEYFEQPIMPKQPQQLPKSMPKPPKMKVAPPSVAKLYVQETDQYVQEKALYPKQPNGEMIICEDPSLPSNMIITGMGPEIPMMPQQPMMPPFAPFAPFGMIQETQVKKEVKLRESSSLWEMESSWFRESRSH